MPPPKIHRRAVKIASTSNAEFFMHGAVIHKRGRFLVGAANITKKTHPSGSGRFSTAHAEIRAIIKAKSILKTDNLDGYSIYVVRINRNGDVKLSRPCQDCMDFIERHNLSVEWSIEKVASNREAC